MANTSRLPVIARPTFDEKVIFSEKPDKHYRLTNFIVTFCEGVLTSIDIQNFIELGLHIIRFRMSNVTRRDKIKLLAMLKSAVKRVCIKYDVSTWPIAISIDLPNASIRTGYLREDFHGPVQLKENSTVLITSNETFSNKCSPDVIYIDDATTLKSVTSGTEVTLSYGDISLVCTEVLDSSIKCKVVKGGMLGNLEHVVFRGIKNMKQDITKKDLELIRFAKEFSLDIITINYVRNSEVVTNVRRLFPVECTPLIISTICDQQGLENIDSIIQVSDGIILAREFLAYNIVNELKMTAIQRHLSAKCQKAGRPFFISGNILERTLLTGAISSCEVSDITNAVLQKSGFVLRNYTEAAYLVKSLRILDSVCRSVESLHTDFHSWKVSTEIDVPVTAAVACLQACAITARQVAARVIILVTVTGRTAEQLSLIAPEVVVLAVTTNQDVARKLRFYRGVIPIVYDKEFKTDWYEETNSRIKFAVSFGVKNEMLKYGKTFISLRKSTPNSAFADSICIWTVSLRESYK